jgi:hypothetical protein
LTLGYGKPKAVDAAAHGGATGSTGFSSATKHALFTVVTTSLLMGKRVKVQAFKDKYLTILST